MSTSSARMSWGGVGPRIALVFAPILGLAIAMRVVWPEASRIALLPPPLRTTLGASLVGLGALFYVATAVRFVSRFWKGELITTGTYGLCRHPIYGSFLVFFVPGAALLADAWPLFVAELALYLAFKSFIHVEDGALAERFGAAYERYRAAVPEILPTPPALRGLAKRVPPSPRLDAWLSGAQFADAIVVRSHAPLDAVMRAVDVEDLTRGWLVLERRPDEIVFAVAGKIHRLKDPDIAELRGPEHFSLFDGPGQEKVAVSFRVLPNQGETLLCLEHRTRAIDAKAARRFALSWLVIRPGAAFVVRRILRAAADRAERTSTRPRGAATTGRAHA